jgi:hypothetical protein
MVWRKKMYKSFNSEVDLLENVDSRRVAIPLGDLRWERDGQIKDTIGPIRHDPFR